MTHLWEVDHPYYCADSNYFASGHDNVGSEHKTFAAFLEEEGDADMSYNLLFRWDWSEEEDPFNGDEYYRNGKLMLFFMGQRKGLYRWVTVEVCRADEAAVIAYLKPRAEHMLKLWEPMFGV